VNRINTSARIAAFNECERLTGCEDDYARRFGIEVMIVVRGPRRDLPPNALWDLQTLKVLNPSLSLCAGEQCGRLGWFRVHGTHRFAILSAISAI
jgi:hypothetical protein